MTAFLVRDSATEFLRQLGIPIGQTALANLACDGGGPRYRIVAGRALYKPEDLMAWIDAQAQTCESPHAETTARRAPPARRKAGAARRARA